MRWLLLLLCGCNQVFDLNATVAVDAQYFDAPPRQPAHCPAFGTDLAFSPQLHQLHYYCVNYQVSLSADLAVTSCIDNDRYRTFSGPGNGRILVTASDGIHELSDNGDGTWTDIQVHSVAQLDLSSLSDGVTLTGDGLRMIFVGQPMGAPSLTLLYADRPSIDAPFSAAFPMQTVEYFPNAFLTEDCARLYVWTLGTVFYVTPPSL